MSSSLRSMQTLLKNPAPTKLFLRHMGGNEKAAIGGGFQFPPGQRQMEQIKNWVGASAIFGALGFTAMCYFTDWKVTNTYIPFYNGKFSDEEDI